MRAKIIHRFAAGTIGVCFAYALIRQPFAVMKNPSELITSEWSVVSSGTAGQSSANSVTTVPSAIPTEPLTDAPSENSDTETYTQRNPFTEQSETESLTEPIHEEIREDSSPQENSSDEELQPQQNESGGDVPTLSQFLSSMTCGGCRHNCSLISPRCMKGRSKAESATVEYYETYGA